MPTTTLHFSRAGVEDLEIGEGTFSARTSDGREITLHKINLSAFISPAAVDKAIYFTDGTAIGQSASFTYDTDTGDMKITGGQLKVGGDSAIADRTLHVAESGAVFIRIENESASAANVGVEWAINGAVDWNLTAVDNESDNLVLSAGSSVDSTPHMSWFRETSAVAIGTKTANSFCPAGLHIDQATDENHILDFQATGSIVHGITSLAPASTYGWVQRYEQDEGGCQLSGVTEANVAVCIHGVSTSSATTASDSTECTIMLKGQLKSGTTGDVLATTGALLGVVNHTTTVMIVRGDGDVHNSGGSTSMTTYDDYDDVKLLQTVKGVMDKSYRDTLGEWIGEHTELLERTGVIRRDEGDTWFISQRGWRGLIVDAFKQLSTRLDTLEQKVNPA